MESIPHTASIIITGLPLVGLGVLAVVLLALAAGRERIIIPGTVMVVLLVAGFAAAFEYRAQLALLLERAREKPEPLPREAVAPSLEPVPLLEYLPAEPEEKPEPEQKPEWIPAARKESEQDRPRRRTVVVSPARREKPPAVSLPVQPPPQPRPQPEPQPEPRPGPKPPPKKPEPKPQAPAPAPEPAFVAPPSPGPVRSGSGRLVITIKGPVVETAKQQADNPHILVLVPDSRHVKSFPPTRISEQRQDNDPNGELLAITYFWEDLTVTFDGMEAGWHVVMIDTALESPGSHQAQMTGTGQSRNDWNGTVEIKAGQTTTVFFRQKDFLSGKFHNPNIRIR